MLYGAKRASELGRVGARGRVETATLAVLVSRHVAGRTSHALRTRSTCERRVDGDHSLACALAVQGGAAGLDFRCLSNGVPVMDKFGCAMGTWEGHMQSPPWPRSPASWCCTTGAVLLGLLQCSGGRGCRLCRNLGSKELL